MPSARLLESIASSNFTALLSSADEDVPSVEEAVRDDRWLAAMNDEYESLERNKTWELVNLPPGRKAVSCMWLLKHKRDAHGNIVRFKARLVARGFTQVFGQDYLDTFAPVAKMSSFKVLLAISSAPNLHLEHLDGLLRPPGVEKGKRPKDRDRSAALPPALGAGPQSCRRVGAHLVRLPPGPCRPACRKSVCAPSRSHQGGR